MGREVGVGGKPKVGFSIHWNRKTAIVHVFIEVHKQP